MHAHVQHCEFHTTIFPFMQLNGLDERFNQTLQSMLVKAAKDLKHIWDEFIDAAVFAYNTSCHESTHHTPFEIMFGRKALLPVEVELHSSAATKQ